ncbi:hypothetical protein FS749_012640 [Ceratobasidium sp. UAMH 11750]|nr:hypothetical protein FS749_012640 [Ceratobasidium sp. UAMH 11750]
MSRIEGPYAFVYFNKADRKLYFARDPLGRRSLLVHLPSSSEPFLALCSASNKHTNIGFKEVSTTGIFSISLENGALLQCASNLVCTPRGRSEGQMILNREIPSDCSNAISTEQIEAFIARLDQSVQSRVSNIPSNTVDGVQCSRPESRLGILFSGGIDCTVLAFLADRHIPPEEPIDLLNVAFENPRALNATKNNNLQEERAQRKRDKKDNRAGISAPSTNAQPVAIEGTKGLGEYDVPDRLTGLEEVEELRRLCPHRQWNFVCVDVPYEECKREEPKIIELMYPSKTVMDLSLALALYFASRGKGRLSPTPTTGDEGAYTCPAKVLLSGLGSDELLGGYSRHRHAYSRGGWAQLIDELQLDLDRLPTRNLGRDDRVISAHGRESRYPFLSLSLVSYLAQLPVHIKVDPRLTSQGGMGDKTLLRLAAERLGLTLASGRVKRAMQFGSRSAKMEAGGAEKKGHVLLE